MSSSPRSPRGFFPADLTPLLVSGWQTNKFDGSIAFWEDVDGVQFTSNSIKAKEGRLQSFNADNKPIRGIQVINEYDSRVWYVGDTAGIHRLIEDDFVGGFEQVGSGYNLVENAGTSSWDNGTSIWDNGSSVWDYGVTEASQWIFTNFGSWIVATDEVGPLRIKKNNETFADLQVNKVSGATITNGGSGYSVDDTVTFDTGSFAATITEVDGSGGATRIKVTNYGSGYSNGDVLTATPGGMTVSLTVPDCPFSRVKSIDKFGPHILAINYDKTSGTEHPYDVAWCSADNPDEWVASSTNSAGSLTLREANSPLKCIVPLGEAKAIYTENQMFILSYLGDPLYFGYETAMTSGVGAVSPKSVISVDRLNYGLSRNGLFTTDGNSVTIIGEEEGINKYIRDNISESEYGQVHAVHDRKYNEVTWHIPVNDVKPNVEITYNYKTGVFTKRTRDVSATFEAGTFDFITSADSNGNLFFEGLSQDNRYVEALTKAHDLGDPNSIKELTSIRVGKIGTSKPKVEIGWANKIDDAPTFNLSDTFYVDEDYKEYTLRTSGRYLFLRISDQGSNDWEISNIVIKGRTRGFR